MYADLGFVPTEVESDAEALMMKMMIEPPA
jgi:hypothetical protein